MWTALRAHREARGLSRAELAALSGVNHVTIWRAETGRVLPNGGTLVALAYVLGVDDARDLATPPKASGS